MDPGWGSKPSFVRTIQIELSGFNDKELSTNGIAPALVETCFNMNKRFLSTLFNVLMLGSLVAIVDGCASKSPSFNAAASHMPTLRAGYARVIFYCNEPASFARQHDFVC